ncbi:MAG: hypothetical protein Q9198_005022, partial [Flavoplaca austrocitrina]
ATVCTQHKRYISPLLSFTFLASGYDYPPEYPTPDHIFTMLECEAKGDSRNISSPLPLPCTIFRLSIPETSSACAIAALASELLGDNERDESKFARAVVRAKVRTRVSSKMILCINDGDEDNAEENKID